jgi:hypothetical protein
MELIDLWEQISWKYSIKRCFYRLVRKEFRQKYCSTVCANTIATAFLPVNEFRRFSSVFDYNKWANPLLGLLNKSFAYLNEWSVIYYYNKWSHAQRRILCAKKDVSLSWNRNGALRGGGFTRLICSSTVQQNIPNYCFELCKKTEFIGLKLCI